MGRKKKELPERISGGYSAIPWSVMDSNAFKGTTDKAKSLLFALMRQHNGKNNGKMQLNKNWLRAHGWTCPESILKARDELVERGLVVETRRGGLNMGLNLYALTWHPITDFTGLDISKQSYRQGAYHSCELPPTKRRNPPKKQEGRNSNRNCTDSVIVTASVNAVTTTVPKTIRYRPLTVTTTENYVITPLPCLRFFKKARLSIRN